MTILLTHTHTHTHTHTVVAAEEDDEEAIVEGDGEIDGEEESTIYKLVCPVFKTCFACFSC